MTHIVSPKHKPWSCLCLKRGPALLLCVWKADIIATFLIRDVATNQHVSFNCRFQISWFTQKLPRSNISVTFLPLPLTVSLQEGEVDCWPLICPVMMCEYTAVAEGECCPRCVTDPCLADNLSYDIRQTCQDPAGVARLSGDTWHMPNSPCTTCKCKVGQSSDKYGNNSLFYLIFDVANLLLSKKNLNVF